LLKLAFIDSLELRAAKRRGYIPKRTCKCVDYVEKEVRFRLCGEFVGEAAQVVALEKIARIDHAAGQVRYIYAGECVGLAQVARYRQKQRQCSKLISGVEFNSPADVSELGVQSDGGEHIAKEIFDFVGIYLCTTVLQTC
jgi:hypothetical protein